MSNAERAADFLVDRATPLALVSILLLTAIAFGAGQLSLASGIRVLFGPDDPHLLAELAIEDAYGREDNILMVVDAGEQSIFTPRNLASVEAMTKRSWQIPHSRRVDSVTNYLHSSVVEDDIAIAPLVENAAYLDDQRIAEIRDIALGQPLLEGRVISTNGRVAAVNITLNLKEEGKAEALAAAVTQAREIARWAQADNPHLRVQLAGLALTEQTLAEVTAADGASLVPLLFVMVLIAMAYLLGSALASLCTVICISLSVAAGMGFAGWSGWSINSVNVSAPTIIMTLAVADCVHLLSSFLRCLAEGMDRREALRKALSLTVYPILLTSVTTAVGFLSMNFSDSPPFAELGTISAVGVMAALWVAVAVLPALILRLPFRAQEAPQTRLPLPRLAQWVVRHQNRILWCGLGLIIGLLTFIPRLSLNDDPAGYFSNSVPITGAIATIEDKFSGTQQVHYSLPAGGADGVTEPAYLRSVEAFVEWLRQQPEVANVDTFTDTLKRLNQVMHADDPAWHRLPEERDLAAQYFLLYEISVPYGQDLTHQVTADKSALKITAVLKNQKSAVVDFEQRSRDWLAANAPGLETRGAGHAVSFASIGLRNIHNMLWGALFAILLVCACLLVAFRSWRFGLVSMLPNLFPALLSLGVWSALVQEVNMAASVVFSMSLGIVVDDTTHFLVKYRQQRLSGGATAVQALEQTFASVGRALVVTSLVLIAGFLVLVMSNFSVNATSGALMALTILFALVIDLVFLPVILLKLDRWLVRSQ